MAISDVAVTRVAAPSADVRHRVASPARRRVAPGPWVLAILVYVGLGALVWWHLWAGGMGGSLPSGSLDPAQDVWWLAWIPHALGQAANPFFTRSMYFPAGVNVLANTSFPLLGLVLSPVTVTAGPLAAMSVAVVLAPAADAFVAFWVLRRYVTWTPAAFVGGMFYGFGPFVATDLRYGHLNLTALVVPPLALVVLDRILVRRTGSPWRAGTWLAVLVIAQFFLSEEVLALGGVVGVLSMVVVLGARGRQWRRGLDYVAKALGTTVVVSAAVLAYPTWWYVRGPRHTSGAVWGDMSRFAASLASFVQPHGQVPGVNFVSGGNGDFLGVPLLVVLVLGAALWWSDRLLRFAMAMVVLCAVLAMGDTLHVRHEATGLPLPAWPLLHLPLLSSAAPSRFGAYLDLFAALALALVVGHVHRHLRLVSATLTRHATFRPGAAARASRMAPWLGAGAVAAAAVLPAAGVPRWPYPAHRVVEPGVLRSLAALPEGTVVREYPLASGTHADGLAWQAQSGMAYGVTAGYAITPGRGGGATVSAPPDAMNLVFAAASLGTLDARRSASLTAVVRAHAFDDKVGAVAVVLPSAGGPALIHLLTTALGPPARSYPSGALWLASPGPAGAP
ncbi:MAG TPA: hypothetical protein DCQ30_09135 [Acidimicrobiaceae bacterium]|nr:hypothetical protein [Acidimicrobiaceae bacterium]